MPGYSYVNSMADQCSAIRRLFLRLRPSSCRPPEKGRLTSVVCVIFIVQYYRSTRCMHRSVGSGPFSKSQSPASRSCSNSTKLSHLTNRHGRRSNTRSSSCRSSSRRRRQESSSRSSSEEEERSKGRFGRVPGRKCVSSTSCLHSVLDSDAMVKLLAVLEAGPMMSMICLLDVRLSFLSPCGL